MQSAWFCQSVLTPCGAKLERGICKWSKEMVDLVGIEPTTSSMPWKRAPKLRHRPTGLILSIVYEPEGIVNVS